MADDFLPDDFQALWRDQPLAQSRLAVEEVRRLADAFHRRIRWRNILEYVAAAAGVASYLTILVKAPNVWIKAGAVMVIAGTVFVCIQLHRRTGPVSMPADFALLPGVEFHRAQLVRQRDALRCVWSWYLLPFLPGFLTIVAASARGLGRAAAALCGLAALFGAIVWLNQRAANQLQREIDRLGSIEKGDMQ